MVTLTGSMPFEETTPFCTGASEPPRVIRSTEIWLLPASTAITNGPSEAVWIAPWDGRPDPVPAPPAANGDPATGVNEPSAWRSNAPIVLVPGVLSST